MSVSRQEEVISVLWIIAAVLAFGHGFTGWGWVFAVKGALDTACAIYLGIREAIIEVRAKMPNAELTSGPSGPDKE